jgi:hypothetical protein
MTSPTRARQGCTLSSGDLLRAAGDELTVCPLIRPGHGAERTWPARFARTAVTSRLGWL